MIILLTYCINKVFPIFHIEVVSFSIEGHIPPIATPLLRKYIRYKLYLEKQADLRDLFKCNVEIGTRVVDQIKFTKNINLCTLSTFHILNTTQKTGTTHFTFGCIFML